MKSTKKELRYTALYCRLSRDDGTESESNSISIQRTILQQYADTHGYTPNKFYIDDGYSGANFNRPGFKSMLQDAENGKIGTILVKDMSRFGRNYLEVGFYTDKLFPSLGIRFIAVNDNVDSENQDSNDFTPIRNIINEWYCKDCSRKMKASYKVRAANGYHLSGFANYGYMIDPENSKHLVVDPEAAEIVKRIFDMFVSGNNLSQIAGILNSEGVLPPSEYKKSKGYKLSKGRHPAVEIPVGWRQVSVRKIIDNYVYCGHSVSLKTRSASYITHEKVANPEDQWIIVKNTHEPIVDEVTYSFAQKIRNANKDVFKSQYRMGPLNLLVYCADCGSKMYYHSYRGGEKSGGGYTCGCYALYKTCTPHSIPQKIIEAGVLENLQFVTSLAKNSEDKFRSLFGLCKDSKEPEVIRQARANMEKAISRNKEIDTIISKLFEQNVAGIISDERFQAMLQGYEDEQRTLKNKIENFKNVVPNMTDKEEQEERLSKFMKLVRTYTDIQELTMEIAHAFIKRVLVHEPVGTSRWDRAYSVTVEYNFIGTITTPKAAEEEQPIDRIMERIVPEAVREFMKNEEKQTIKNADIRKLTGMDSSDATSLLRRMCKAGIIESAERKTCGKIYRIVSRPKR